MSAIQMTCPHCGGKYIAGVVGKTPWPTHRCLWEQANRGNLAIAPEHRR